MRKRAPWEDLFTTHPRLHKVKLSKAEKFRKGVEQLVFKAATVECIVEARRPVCGQRNGP